MRIGYDGKRIFNNYTGLGNYSRYILSLMRHNYPQNEYLIYTPSPPKGEIAQDIVGFAANKIITAPANSVKWFWRSYGIVQDLIRDKAELYHGLSNELPFGISSANIPSVVTIHDLIFIHYPEYYPKTDAWIYKIKTRYACKHANRIIAVSEQTKKDIVRFFKIPAEKIDVVYQDCNQQFKKTLSGSEKKQISAKYGLPEKYLLSVGTIETRKNLLLAVKALKLIDEDISLVVIGKEKPYAAEVKQYISENGLQKRVLFLKDVAYTDLPAIYQRANIFVYPSRFEGFGIPVIEALHSRIPVIAATGSCLQEAGGEGSLYTHPDNFEQLASLIKSVLHNPEKRAAMIEAGISHVQNFSDEVIAAKLINTYQKAIDVKK